MAVDLYIVRHAIAAERGSDWPDDSKRPLTERGVERFEEAVAGLMWLGMRVDIVLTSPLVRAKQTAELLVSGLPSKPQLKAIPTLAPGHTPGETMEQVAHEGRGHAGVAVVGHEPGLGGLTAWLVGTRRAIPLKKGGVCHFQMDSFSSRHGTLQWLATPRMLRKLGR